MGWALFEDGRLADEGVYFPPEGHGGGLVGFEDFLHGLVDTAKPTRLVLEQPFQGRRRWSFAVLIQYVAVVHMVHFRHFGCEMPPGSTIQARTVKKLHDMPAKQPHTVNKRNAVALVNQLYNCNFVFHTNKQKSQDDIADAILLGRTWHMRHGYALVA